MKNIIVGLLTVVIIGLMGYTFMGGGAYHGGEYGKVIEDFGDTMTAGKTVAIEEKDDRKKEMDKLSALRDKAGSAGAFKVSNEYKSKCASCHGVNGSGMQNGKPMMGPKIFGQSAEKLYKDLVEFKSGRKENVVMKGLLIPLSEEDLKRLADEIGEFPARAEAAKQ
ncbi:c-type cytochrome [Sulfurovum sp. CS9]|uniref:c-type cytochrome n=1 Tax=Sulfurovum sp. CS9 TaxID=3391146 RepID=UPI0039EA4FFB